MDFSKTQVYSLKCKSCLSLVNERGMKVYLVSNSNVKLYSSDLDSGFTKESEEIIKAEFCECGIKNLACSNCEDILGYRVVSPCSPCQEGSNNGHYWLYKSVNGSKIENSFWGDLVDDKYITNLPE